MKTLMHRLLAGLLVGYLFTAPVFAAEISSSGGAGGVDTNANTECVGDTVYLSGEGNCNVVTSGATTEAAMETQLTDVINLFTNNDGALNDDNVTLADVQAATTSDFHNIGGTDADTQLSQEQVEDFAGALVTDGTGTHTRITVTYQDSAGDVDFVVDDMNDDVPESGDFGNAVDLDATGAVSANAVALTTDTTGNYVDDVTANQGLLLTGTEGATVGLQDCAANQVLKRNAGDTAWECAADSTGGAPSFDAITTGTNTTATMTVGTGATITTSGSGTIVATTAAALAADGGDCSAGSAPIGVDAAGAAESCTDYEEDLSNSAGLLGALSDETGTGVAVFGTTPTIATPVLTGKIDRNNVAVNDDDCTGEQGLYWYDTTDSAFEFCNANSGVPTTLGGVVNTADIADVSVTQTELAELQTIGATTISANQWGTLGGIAETLTSTELNLLDGITVLSGSNTGDNDEVGTKTTGDLCINNGSQVNCGVNLESELETALDGINVIVATELDTKTELEGILGDVSDLAEADGDVYTGVHDFGGATIEVDNGTVASLPAAGTVGRVAVVTDGNADDDCTTGGGSTFVLCMDNGTIWEPTGDSGAGSGDITSVGADLTGAVDNLVMTFAGVPLDVQNTTDAASNQVGIFRGGNRATAADNDEMYNSYFVDNDAGSQVEMGRITAFAADVSNTIEVGGLYFSGRLSGTIDEYIRIGFFNHDGNHRNVVMNEDGIDMNFYWESESSNIMTIDGGNGNESVTIGGTGKLAQLGIDGFQDNVQFLVQAHSTQTNDIVVIEDSSGNDIFIIDEDEHLDTNSSTPILSSCGTTPTIDGTDIAGSITIGTGATTSCTATFAIAYNAKPHCAIVGSDSAVTYAATTTTNEVVVTSSADMASDVIMYTCFGG